MRHRDPRKPHCRPNSRGVQAPLGFWDPAGLSSDGDAKEFYRRRVVEIKPGRVSMLACTGYIVQDGLELLLYFMLCLFAFSETLCTVIAV